MKIGFIGQGWVGKAYADNFEERGFQVVRYGLEKKYKKNRDKIASCDCVFIAIPTPTTPSGVDYGPLRECLHLVGSECVAIIKSTILPGTTKILQAVNRRITVVHSPEFLSEATATHDVRHPDRTIVGIGGPPCPTASQYNLARKIITLLPRAETNTICSSTEAEMIKYAGNCLSYTKIVFVNILYDLARDLGCNWAHIQNAVGADPRIGTWHLSPVHKSGRGAGGSCFIKDFEAFRQLYTEVMTADYAGLNVLDALTDKNCQLLKNSGKDPDKMNSVFK